MASASAAPADSAVESARETRFQSELSRAQKLWQEPPSLGKCAEIMKEDGDRALCATAESALARVAALPPSAASSDALPPLGDAALALVRLFERARYLSLEQLGREHMEGDAGARAAASAAPRVAPFASSGARVFLSKARDQKRLKLVEGPLGVLAQNAGRLERDVLRQLGAYLEYGPLSVRKSAFERADQLNSQHPQWPALHRLVREASVLETDPELRARLQASAGKATPELKPAQTTGSK